MGTVKSNEERSPLLKSNVLFGYCDLLGVGCRALLGLHMGYNYHEMKVQDVDGLAAKCQRSRTLESHQRYFEPFQILDCKFEDYTVVIANADVPSDRCHHVINRLLDMCVWSKVKRIVVVSSLRLEFDIPNRNMIFETCFFTAKVTGYPSLPSEVRIQDSMLSSLIQAAQVERFPLIIVSAVGHKAQQRHGDDHSNKAVRQMQQILNEMTGLEFDFELSESLIYNDGRNSAMHMYS